MISIALLEDNIHFRLSLEQMIAGMEDGRLVGSFRDAEEAIRYMKKIEPDVFLVDINLPGLSGVEFLLKAKPMLPDTEFLVCSVRDDSSSVFQCLRNGATGYLLKDSSAQDIKDAIREVKAGGSPMSADISRKVIALFHKLPATSPPADYNLTSRECEVLDLLSDGLLYKEIAARLDVQTGTIKKHIRNIYEKLQVQNKVEAVNKYSSGRNFVL